MLIIEIHARPIEENTLPTPPDEILGESIVLPVEKEQDWVRNFLKTLVAWWQATQSHTHHGNGLLL